MRWCQDHWDGLRAEVKKQGLSALVPDSVEQAAHNLEANLQGEDTIDTFDPLMGAMWAINAFIGEQLGPGGQLTVLMYDGCPICKADAVHLEKCDVENCDYGSVAKFFPNAVQDEVAHWQELNA